MSVYGIYSYILLVSKHIRFKSISIGMLSCFQNMLCMTSASQYIWLHLDLGSPDILQSYFNHSFYIFILIENRNRVYQITRLLDQVFLFIYLTLERKKIRTRMKNCLYQMIDFPQAMWTTKQINLYTQCNGFWITIYLV